MFSTNFFASSRDSAACFERYVDLSDACVSVSLYTNIALRIASICGDAILPSPVSVPSITF